MDLTFHNLQPDGPSAGALDAESPKSKKTKSKQLLGREIYVSLWICTIFCMREAVTIPYGSRILPMPLGLPNDLKTPIRF